MLLTEMLQRELKREIKAEFTDTEEERIGLVATATGLSYQSIKLFLDTGVPASFNLVNMLFERYRSKIINPIKAKTIYSV